jgi:hypothetical protein
MAFFPKAANDKKIEAEDKTKAHTKSLKMRPQEILATMAIIPEI